MKTHLKAHIGVLCSALLVAGACHYDDHHSVYPADPRWSPGESYYRALSAAWKPVVEVECSHTSELMNERCYLYKYNPKMIRRIHVMDEQVAAVAKDQPELVLRAHVYQLAFRMGQTLGTIVGEETGQLEVLVSRQRAAPIRDYVDFAVLDEEARKIGWTLTFSGMPTKSPTTASEIAEFNALLHAADDEIDYERVDPVLPPSAPLIYAEFEEQWNAGWTGGINFPFGDAEIVIPKPPRPFVDHASYWKTGWERGFVHGYGIGSRASEVLLNSE